MINPKSTSADKKRIVGIAFIAIVSVILLIQSYGKAYRDSGYDFTSYIYASKLLSEDQNPYDPTSSVASQIDYPKPSFPYIYPLTLAFLMTPLSYIPYSVAISIWFFAGLFSLLFTIYLLTKRETNETGGYRKRTDISIVSSLAILLLFNIVQNNFLNGQLNFIILLLSVLSYDYCSRGKKFTAAFVLALAVSLKLTPVIFLLYFLLKKEYKLFLYSTAMIPLLLLLPYLLIGNNITAFYSYYANNFLFEPGQNLNFLLSIFNNVYGRIAVIIALLLILISITLLYGKYRSRIIQNNVFSVYCLFLLLLTPKLQTHTLIFIMPAVVIFLMQVSDSFKELKKLPIFLAAFSLIVFYISRSVDIFNLVYLTIFILLISLVLNLHVLKRYQAVQ